MGYIDYIAERKFIALSDFIFVSAHGDTYHGTPILRNTDTNKLFDGCVIYLVYDIVYHFLQLIPQIKVKFTLISGFSDYTVPYFSDHYRLDTTPILRHPGLVGWYALNITHDFPKLHHLPIGIPRSIPFLGSSYDVDKKDNPDFEEYMGWYRRDTFMDMEWVYRIQSPTLPAILERMKEKVSSDKLLYVSFTAENSDRSNIGANCGFRRALQQYIEDKTPFEFQPLRPWKKYVDTLKDYKYTIEPFGRCMDGYRVWEALYLGVIPIVFRSPINELHSKLPFLIIDSFDQITPEYLEKQYPMMLERVYELERLDMEYWRKRIKPQA